MISILLLAALSGPVVYFVMRWARKYSAWVDTLAPWAKRSVTTVVGVLLAFAWQRLGIEAPTDLGAFTPEVISGVLTAVIGHLLHRVEDPKDAEVD